MSYLILADGTIQVTTEQEALAIRAHLLAGTPDIAALQGRLRSLSEVLRACQDELGGAAPEALPGLIRQLRLMEPNDQLRIERNYWRARSMELGEECIIWQKRAGRDALPTAEVFADLQAKVKAACSNFALQMAAAKPASEPRVLAARSDQPAADRPPPDDLTPDAAAPPCEPSAERAGGSLPPRLELMQIRERLGLSQRELAAELGQTQARISLMERGNAKVAPELLAAARALGSPAKQEANGVAPPDEVRPVEQQGPPAMDMPAPDRSMSISDADLDELAGVDASEDAGADDAHTDGEAP